MKRPSGRRSSKEHDRKKKKMKINENSATGFYIYVVDIFSSSTFDLSIFTTFLCFSPYYFHLTSDALEPALFSSYLKLSLFLCIRHFYLGVYIQVVSLIPN